MGEVGNDDRRVVAYFDILGFSDRVERETNLSELSRLCNLVLLPSDGEVDRRAIRFRIFSDSLFVVVDNRRLGQQLVEVILFCHTLLARSIRLGLPVRGAVGVGRLLWNNDVTVGPAIVEVAKCADGHDWIGIALAPSAARLLQDDERLCRILTQDGPYLVRYPVPVKPAPGESVAWVLAPPRQECAVLIQTLERMLPTHGRVDVQRKILHTLSFFQMVSPNLGGS